MPLDHNSKGNARIINTFLGAREKGATCHTSLYFEAIT